MSEDRPGYIVPSQDTATSEAKVLLARFATNDGAAEVKALRADLRRLRGQECIAAERALAEVQQESQRLVVLTLEAQALTLETRTALAEARAECTEAREGADRAIGLLQEERREHVEAAKEQAARLDHAINAAKCFERDLYQMRDRWAEARAALALADKLAAAADAVLDVTVAATPDTHLMRVATQIGGLNAAWQAWDRTRKIAGQPAGEGERCAHVE